MPIGQRLAVIGAAAAIGGGALWIVKGGAILVAGYQPPLLFEAAALLFPVALLGLHSRLAGRGGRQARIGGALARLAAAAGVTTAVYAFLVRDPSGVLFGITIGVAGLATFLGLLLLGRAARDDRTFPPPWTSLPFAMGVAAIPAMTLIGGLLEAIHERLLELPLVAYGVAWVVLGVLLWSPRSPAEPDVRTTPRPEGPSSAG